MLCVLIMLYFSSDILVLETLINKSYILLRVLCVLIVLFSRNTDINVK